MKATVTKQRLWIVLCPPTCHISLPENIAFDLMGKAMRTTTDETLIAEWNRHKNSLAMRTTKSRKAVRDNTGITDEALLKILPIHPYAALLFEAYFCCV